MFFVRFRVSDFVVVVRRRVFLVIYECVSDGV